MKLKNNEDKSVDAQILLRKGNKILMGANIETKYGAESEGKAIQTLPHLRIHLLYTVTKPSHYCRCSEELADRSLI